MKMIFGAIVSAVLACGVLSFFGMFRGTASPLGIGAGVLLTALYFAVFRAAALGREKAVRRTVHVLTWPEAEDDKEVVAAAAA